MSSPPGRLVSVDIYGTRTTAYGGWVVARPFRREEDGHGPLHRVRTGALDGYAAGARLLGFAEGRPLADVEAVLRRTPKPAELDRRRAARPSEIVHVGDGPRSGVPPTSRFGPGTSERSSIRSCTARPAAER